MCVRVQGAIFEYYTFIVRTIVIIIIVNVHNKCYTCCVLSVVCISNSYVAGNDECVGKTDAQRKKKCNKLILIGAMPRHSYIGVSAISAC